MNRFSWRLVFPIFAAVGFMWSAAWYTWFRDTPAEHRSITPEELAKIEAGREAVPASQNHGFVFNSSILALCVMYFTQSYGFYFIITWLPTYLEKQKGLSSNALSLFSGLPLLLSIGADLFGGLSTDRVSQRFGLRAGRCAVGGLALLAAGIFMIVGTATPQPWIAGVLIAMAGASANFPLGAAWGACLDIAGPRAGVVGGTMNTAGQVGGALSPVVFAYLTRNTVDWSTPLYIIGGLYLVGALAWFWVHPERTA
jgi:ACS family glucarate transporter-like MFS transporter